MGLGGWYLENQGMTHFERLFLYWLRFLKWTYTNLRLKNKTKTCLARQQNESSRNESSRKAKHFQEGQGAWEVGRSENLTLTCKGRIRGQLKFNIFSAFWWRPVLLNLTNPGAYSGWEPPLCMYGVSCTPTHGHLNAHVAFSTDSFPKPIFRSKH